MWTAKGRRRIAKCLVELPKPLAEIAVAAWVTLKLLTPLVIRQTAMVQKVILNVVVRCFHCVRFVHYCKLLEAILDLPAQPLLSVASVVVRRQLREPLLP